MDKVDEFLYKQTDPNSGISIFDPITKSYDVLNEEEVKIVRRLRSGTFTDENFNPYTEYCDYFTGDVLSLPINCMPEPKSRFIPSAAEFRKIRRLVKAIRNGIAAKKKRIAKKSLKYTDIWAKDKKISDLTKSERWRLNMRWRAPKAALPGNDESYHPSEEYLPDQDQIDAWNVISEEEKRGKFLPALYRNLRSVPSYDLLSQNYDRCLDLYICPRKQKLMIDIDPDDLLPKLPNLSELQPFPSWESVIFSGHNDAVTDISIHATGEFLVSSDKGGLVIIWETNGIPIEKYQFTTPISSVKWNPRKDIYLLSIATQSKVLIMPLSFGNKNTYDRSLMVITEFKKTNDSEEGINWSYIKRSSKLPEHILINHAKFNKYGLTGEKCIEKLKWHISGTFLSVILNKDGLKNIIIHHIFKYQSQSPFNKNIKNLIDVEFHPTRPYFYLITSTIVKAYNLKNQTFYDKYKSNLKENSSISLHPSGDHFIFGSDDSKIAWLDLDNPKQPYKTLRLHKKGISSISFHPIHSLMACASLDSNCSILYTKVYNDYATSPLIIPLKILNSKRFANGSALTCCEFHPQAPSVFTADETGCIRMFQ